jgi:D-serine dehydratase
MTSVPNAVSRWVQEYQIDDTIKGIPGGTESFPLSQIARKAWNVLRQDLPLPLMVLNRSALFHNIGVMNAFLQANGLALAPHAKTHMSPQLAALQLANGAWAITAGTVNQVQVFRKFGISRIVLANQLVGRQNLRSIIEALNADSTFEFYSVVDSVENVNHLAEMAKEFELTRPLKVLLEGGFIGGRAGCRTIEHARDVIAQIRKAHNYISLAGIEGFEGVIAHDDPAVATAQVTKYLEFLNLLLAELKPEDLGAAEEVILRPEDRRISTSVAKSFHEIEFFLPSGWYSEAAATSLMTRACIENNRTNDSLAAWQGDLLKAAFEIWSYVQSIPENGLAILTMGKRDCPYDYYLPTPCGAIARARLTLICQVARSPD